MLHFFWGFNGVSSETSNVYVRTYNFRPSELQRYNYFILYTMKKTIKKIFIQICGPTRTWMCGISFGVSTGFRLKFQTCMYECIIFGRKNLNDTIISLSKLWKKIKINSHSNLRPFKYMKMRYFIWCFNGVSF